MNPNEIQEYCYRCDALVNIIPEYSAGYVSWECENCGTVIDSEAEYHDDLDYWNN